MHCVRRHGRRPLVGGPAIHAAGPRRIDGRKVAAAAVRVGVSIADAVSILRRRAVVLARLTGPPGPLGLDGAARIVAVCRRAWGARSDAR